MTIELNCKNNPLSSPLPRKKGPGEGFDILELGMLSSSQSVNRNRNWGWVQKLDLVASPASFKANCPQRGCKLPLSLDVYARTLSGRTSSPVPCWRNVCVVRLLTTHSLHVEKGKTTFPCFELKPRSESLSLSSHRVEIRSSITKERERERKFLHVV